MRIDGVSPVAFLAFLGLEMFAMTTPMQLGALLFIVVSLHVAGSHTNNQLDNNKGYDL